MVRHKASIRAHHIGSVCVCALGVFSLAALPAAAQQKPIAYAPTAGVTIAGSLQVTNNRAAIGSNATITAGDQAARIQLTRGGSLKVCQSTKIQLSADKSLGPDTGPGDDAIMIALNHGAFEAHDTPGKYSDVVMTPDLRILVSGPGKADMSFRVGANGDTCIDNLGKNAPYVTVQGLFSGSIYRVQPNQRVLIEHGDLGQVVDNEPEPCGCPPPPEAIAQAGPGLGHGNSKENQAAMENPFPLAESEGLKPPPPPPTTPVVPVGQVHAEMEVPLTYNGATARSAPITTAPLPAASAPPSAPVAAAKAPAPPNRSHHRDFFGGIGRFFSHLFGHK